MKKPRVVIGIDCGESSTKTQIANLDHLNLADHTAESLWNGNMYPDDTGIAGVISRIILSLCKDNGIGFDQVAAIVLVFPGNRRDDDYSNLIQKLRDQWKRRKYIPKILYPIGAPQLALKTYFPSHPAVFVSCDINACVFARDTKDQYIVAGGWGGRVPDPGSARDIARSILQYISQVYDGRSINSPYFKAITKELAIDSRGSFHKILFEDFDTNKLVDFTIRAAEERNIVATTILDTAANELVDMIRHVATRLPVSKRIPILLTGRLLEDVKLYRAIVHRKLSATLPHITVSPQMYNVSESAVHFAVDLMKESKRTRKSI